MTKCAPACARCGAHVPVAHPRLELLRLYGWRLFAEPSAVKNGGHRQEWLLLPDVDGEAARLVPGGHKTRAVFGT